MSRGRWQELPRVTGCRQAGGRRDWRVLRQLIAVVSVLCVGITLLSSACWGEGDDCDCLDCCDSSYVLQTGCASNRFPPEGQRKALVIFARLEGDAPHTGEACWAQWPSEQGLPDYAPYFIVPTTNPDSFPEPSLNDYYWKMSCGKYLLHGQSYPSVVWADPEDTIEVNKQVIATVGADSAFDFSEFDVDPVDSLVDIVFVIWRCGVESHSNLFYCDTLPTWDGFGVVGEFGATVGISGSFPDALSVLAHEHWHNLCGGPHLMFTSRYGVAADGTYRGICMSAPEREYLGWLGNLVTVSTDTVQLRLPEAVLSGSAVKVLVPRVPQDSLEYFLLENRQRNNWYCGTAPIVTACKYMPGPGVLIWHVDYGSHSHTAFTAPFWKPVDVESATGLFETGQTYGTIYPWGPVPDSFHGLDDLDSLFVCQTWPCRRWRDADYFGNGWSNAFTPYTNPNSNAYFWNESRPADRDWMRWEQSIPTGISITNIREGAGDTMLVDIHFDTPSDTITTDTHWAKWMMLGGDLTVAEGCTLTIDPGAKVSFTPEADSETSGFDTGRIELNVEGSLIAKGEPGHRIRFEPAGRARGHDPQPYDWYGIRLERGSLDTLVRCDIGFGYAGLSIGYGSNQSQSVWPFISKSVIDSNLYSGIDCDHANPTISECRVEYNGTSEAGGIGIYACNSSMKVWSDTIRQNLPYNVYMIAGDPDTAHFADISDCTVSGVGASDPDDAYGIVLSRNFWPGSRIARTSVKKCSQQGIGLQYYWGVVEVDSCTISNNCYGIVTDRAVQAPPRPDDTLLVYANTIKNNTTGVLRRKVGGTILLGDSTAAIAGYNSFTGTGTHVCNLMSSTIVAENNWWGSDPPNPFKFVGPVDYAPWLQAAPGQGEASMRSGNSGGILVCSNPSGSMVEFAINAANGGPAVLDVYDVRGKLVKQVTRGDLSPGAHKFAWDGSDSHGATVSKGVYFGRLRLRGEIYTTKVILLK